MVAIRLDGQKAHRREVGELADRFIEVFVPHIVYSASRTSHDDCADAEKA